MAAPETRLLIGGELVAGDGAGIEVENPFTEQAIATVNAPSDEQLGSAIAAARESSREWMRTPAVDRGELLHEVANRIESRADELAEAMTLEVGKPLIENRDEVSWVVACFRYYAEIGRDSAGRVIPSIESSQLAMVLKEPHGVWGCIVPWNYPLLLLAWKLAPALAAGNATVCKPSEVTPLSTLMLAPCVEHLPAGVVNLVAGGGEVGAAITADPRIDGVAFTGSVETGKKVGHACMDRVARVNLEMGGKDPFIICADIADQLDVAARGGAWAAFLNAGQVCTSSERFYVMDDVYDDYVNAFVDVAKGLVIGDPMRSDTDVGPMVSANQRSKVEAQVSAAVSAGAEVLVGGDSGGNERGHFYTPAVVTG
ncbi:MAG: aldehyde dehydrogenase family protein, partial [Solirubrobacterales bacterium]